MKPPTVPLPTTKTKVAKRLLQMLLACHPRHLKTQDTYDQLAELMAITAEERGAKLTTASGEENAWENLVRQAVRLLVQRGYVPRWTESGRGVWCLTDVGVNYARNPSGITLDDPDGDVDF
jgi:predicted ArsR family transcriptional regulator